jgi:hypothetical protein
MKLNKQKSLSPEFPKFNDIKRGVPFRSLALTFAAGALFSISCSKAATKTSPSDKEDITTPSSRKAIQSKNGNSSKSYKNDQNSIADMDGDGIPNNVDKCPDMPEDKDNYQDKDGCPDPDNDKDGILDINDKCPNQPEDKNGIKDDDGCPDAKKVRIRHGGVMVRPRHP